MADKEECDPVAEEATTAVTRSEETLTNDGDCVNPSLQQSSVIKQSRARLSALIRGFRASEPDPAEAEAETSERVDVEFLLLDAAVAKQEITSSELELQDWYEKKSEIVCDTEAEAVVIQESPQGLSEDTALSDEHNAKAHYAVNEDCNGVDEAVTLSGVVQLDGYTTKGLQDASLCLQGEAGGAKGLAYEVPQMEEAPMLAEGEVGAIEGQSSEDNFRSNECMILAMSNSEINTETEENRRLSLKRNRSCFDNTPSVQITYKCLTSESKNKLKDFLQQWAAWHGKSVCQKDEADKDTLENGEEVYFPALHVGGQSNFTMSFWMDKPAKQARTETSLLELEPISQEREKQVPLYDRAGVGALMSQETGMLLQGNMELAEEDSRCFNCGSYSHSMKECPRPRDNVAINNARKLLSEKRGPANGLRNGSRYYQSSPGGKFDDLKPGVLRSETRQLLGIGELDPPPWLQRMRELGYPPGYLENQEDEPSGITIFGTGDADADVNYVGEDGEIVGGGSAKRKSSAQKMTVTFPGINAPIPDEADKRTWCPPLHASGKKSSSRMGYSTSYPDGGFAVDAMAYRGGGGWGSVAEAPPGTGHDSYANSPNLWSPSLEDAGSFLKGSPRVQGKGTSSGSPHWNRSLSDSGRHRPKVNYDDARSMPPLMGPPSGSRHTPPMHGSQRSYQQLPLTPSPTQRGLYSQEHHRDEGSDARRRAWLQANDALDSLQRSTSRYPSSRR